MKNICGIILAAGKGTRINAKKINKVMYPLAGKPMISYTVDLLKKSGLKKIIIVVGFAKESIIKYFGRKYIYVWQKKRLGTAHAVSMALPKIPALFKSVFVCYSDDTAFYPALVIKNLINFHFRSDSDMTLLTAVKQNPFGLGRILRQKNGKITGVVEEKNAAPKQKKIKEINTGCYCFKVNFLKKYISLIKKDSLKGEYYLPDIISLAIANKKKVNTLKISKGAYFQGVNTKEQLKKADQKMKRIFLNKK